MKKLLALVLALVMTMSLAVSANAFTDDKDVKYTEAVEVLADMGILKGYENGSFNPNGNITRAEAAAILYRVYTKDVAEKSKDLYAGYGKFADVTSAYSWAAGVIGYCANAEIIKGYNETTFGPADSVTGYQILAMLLRAVGYDKNGEFTGNGWETQVAKVAQQAGVLVNVGTENLAQPASRQLVAELVFRTLVVAEQVTYTPAFGYVATKLVADKDTLGVQNFDLTWFGGKDADGKITDKHDKWGRPSYGWTYNVGAEITSWNYDCVSYNVATSQCDIASDIGLKTNKDFTVYTNGYENDSKQNINAIKTKLTVGEQGQIVEVYNDTAEIVVIDTYLAKVEKVTANTYDKAGHLRNAATLTLTVYDSANGTEIVLTSKYTDYTYAAGDMLLVNSIDADKKLTNDIDVLGYATSIEGNQTKIWNNKSQHTVEGTTYADAYQFNHDEAKQDSKGTYYWYFDQFGNLIGAFVKEAVYNYAVLTSIKYNTSDDTTTGTLVYMDGTTETVTIAKIANGVTTYSYDSNNFGVKKEGEKTYFYVTTSAKTNNALDTHGWIAGHLLKVEENKDGSINLTEVEDEIKDTNVYNKGNKIGSVKVDNATMFLVLNQKTNEFETYTGIKEVPNMVKCTVDYILGANGVAKYVFVIGTPATVTATTYDLVLLTEASNYEDLGDDLYAINVDENEEVVIKTADEELAKALAGLTDVLVYITYKDDLAVAYTEIKGTPVAVGKTDDGDVVYAKYVNSNGLSYENGILYRPTDSWNVEEAELITTDKDIDSIEDVVDLADYIVYVVYTDSGNNHIVSTLYLVYAPDDAE